MTIADDLLPLRLSDYLFIKAIQNHQTNKPIHCLAIELQIDSILRN
jgi:hypothetical protein